MSFKNVSGDIELVSPAVVHAGEGAALASGEETGLELQGRLKGDNRFMNFTFHAGSLDRPIGHPASYRVNHGGIVNKFFGGFCGVAVAVSLLGCSKAKEKDLKDLSPEEFHRRWHTEAPAALQVAITNAIVGYARTVEQKILDDGDRPEKWTANVTVEFINRLGGIERTNVPFIFFQSGYTVACSADVMKLMQRLIDEVNSR